MARSWDESKMKTHPTDIHGSLSASPKSSMMDWRGINPNGPTLARKGSLRARCSRRWCCQESRAAHSKWWRWRPGSTTGRWRYERQFRRSCNGGLDEKQKRTNIPWTALGDGAESGSANLPSSVSFGFPSLAWSECSRDCGARSWSWGWDMMKGPEGVSWEGRVVQGVFLEPFACAK